MKIPKEIIDSPDKLCAYCVEKGFKVTVRVISDSKIDGKVMPLPDAIHATSMNGSGTIISCIPGRLAYYYDEVGERRGLLKRSQT